MLKKVKKGLWRFRTQSLRRVNLLVSNKFVYLGVLTAFIFLDLNLNFLHKKFPVPFREEIEFRIREQFKINELEHFSNLFELLQKSIEKSRDMRDFDFIFSMGRFNIHFLSRESLAEVERVFRQLDPGVRAKRVRIRSSFLNQLLQVESYLACHEVVLQTQGLDFENLQLDRAFYGRFGVFFNLLRCIYRVPRESYSSVHLWYSYMKSAHFTNINTFICESHP